MLGNNLLYVLFVAAATGAHARPGMEARALTVSKDGTCGGSITCAGSKFGSCCSQYGYCGSVDAYCGTGCQTGLGTCGSSSSPSKPGKASTTAAAPVQSATPAATSSADSTPVDLSGFKACTSGTPLVQNPSFEDGSTSWTLSGGSAIQKTGDWKGQAAPSGTKYVKMLVDSNNAQSAIWQRLDMGDNARKVTLDFDWSLMVTVSGSRPPLGDCSLEVTFAGNLAASWIRPAGATSAGHMQATFNSYNNVGDLALTFSCTQNLYSSGLLIDNVQMTAC